MSNHSSIPTILALDTSSENCSVALFHQGEYSSFVEHAPRQHAKRLLPMIESILSSRGISMGDIDGIGFGQGPGSFTGLRIAAGVAQGLAYGANCSLIPVSNLQAMALHRCQLDDTCEQVFVAIDARMDEVYWAQYEKSEENGVVVAKAVVSDSVSAPEKVNLQLTKCLMGVGSGFVFAERFPEELKERLTGIDENQLPEAESICHIAVSEFGKGHFCEPAEAVPVYIRDEITWKKLPGRE